MIAWNSSFAYKGKTIDVRQIGEELVVQYALEGSIRSSGDRIRLNTQLIDTSNGNQVWAERYDRMIDDMFDLQDDITREVVTALRTIQAF